MKRLFRSVLFSLALLVLGCLSSVASQAQMLEPDEPARVVSGASGAYVLIGPDSGGIVTESALRDRLGDRYGEVVVDDLYRQADDTRGDSQRFFAGRQATIKRLKSLLRERQSVDIFVLGHNNEHFNLLDELSAEEKAKIRLVYNSGCTDLKDASEWRTRGVRTYIAHRADDSCSPVFFLAFLGYWTDGASLEESVSRGNRALTRELGEGDSDIPGLLGAICHGIRESRVAYPDRATYLTDTQAKIVTDESPRTLNRITIRSHRRQAPTSTGRAE